MSLSADYRRLLRRENKCYSIIQKSFKKQRQFLDEHLQDLYENYTLNIELAWNYLNTAYVNLYREKARQNVVNDEPLGWFWLEMWVDDMIEDLKPQIKKGVMKWYKRSFRLFEPLLIENWFSYYEDTISNYANERWELNLSNYRWAISYTTKHDVVEILKNWIDENLTRWEVQKQINMKNDLLFGKARARTIAITEMWKAYEYWNYQPIQQLMSVWIEMEKKWQTCDDAKVRPEHMECEDEWRVSADYVYPSVWVPIPPGWPNCRCTILYSRKWAIR